MMDQQGNGQKCGCPHHKVVPFLIFLFGLVFLLGMTGTISQQTAAYSWPVILMIVGLTKMFSGSCKCCNKMC